MAVVYIFVALSVLCLAWSIATIIATHTSMSNQIPFDPGISSNTTDYWADTDPGDDNRFV